MSDENAAEHWHEYQELIAERANGAGLETTIDAISRDNTELVHDLSEYDSKIAIPFIASLLTPCVSIELHQTRNFIRTCSPTLSRS